MGARAAVGQNVFDQDAGVQNQNTVRESAGYFLQVRQANIGAFVGVANHQKVAALPREALSDANKLGVERVGDDRQNNTQGRRFASKSFIFPKIQGDVWVFFLGFLHFLKRFLTTGCKRGGQGGRFLGHKLDAIKIAVSSKGVRFFYVHDTSGQSRTRALKNYNRCWREHYAKAARRAMKS